MERAASYLSSWLPSVPALSEVWQRGLPEGRWRTAALTLGIGAGVTGALVARQKYRYRGLPPGPPSGLFGATGVNVITLDLDLTTLSEKYGDVFSIRLGPTVMIILASHSAMKEAFVKQGDTFADRGDDICILRDLLNLQDDVFTSPYTTEGWNQKKTAIMGCLRGAGFGQTKETDEKIIVEFEKLVNYLEPLRAENKPINLRNILPKVMINIIFQILLSKEYEFDDPQIDESLDMVHQVSEAFLGVIPIAFLPKLFAKIFCRPMIRKALDKFRKLREFITAEVEFHISSLDTDNPRDFIDNYLMKIGSDDIPRIVDNIINFLPDACDNLALIIEWVLLYLAYHPNIQERVALEISQITGGSRHVTWVDRASLPVLEATFREVLRLSTPLTMTASHRVLQETTLRGYRIPTNVPVFGLIYSAHRDPAVYTDPHSFNPDRFLDSSGKLIKSDIWIPFSMGRRKCMGEQLVQIEALMILANFVQRYKFRFPEGATVDLERDPSHVMHRPKVFSLVLEDRTTTQIGSDRKQEATFLTCA